MKFDYYVYNSPPAKLSKTKLCDKAHHDCEPQVFVLFGAFF